MRLLSLRVFTAVVIVGCAALVGAGLPAKHTALRAASGPESYRGLSPVSLGTTPSSPVTQVATPTTSSGPAQDADPRSAANSTTPVSVPVANPNGTFTAVVETIESGHPVFRSITADSVVDAHDAAAATPGAVSVSWDAPVHALTADPDRSFQYGLDMLRETQFTARPDVSGVTVAVVDTGVFPSHNDFAAGTVIAGVDLVGDGASTDGRVDPHGHGTHVAGIIGAASDNGIGIEGFASGVKILPIRVLDATGSGSASNVANGIIAAVNLGADVINASIGGGYASVYQTAVNYATDHNVVVVAAAGNTAQSGNAVQYPGAIPDVVSVAALDSTTTRASFSTHNSQVDVAAPGVSILSLGTSSSSYVYMSGTSQATPHVAATFALARAAHPSMTAPQLWSLMSSTATDLEAAGRDDDTGWGLINPLAMVAGVPSAPDITSMVPGAGTMTVNWTTPSDNGAAITQYGIVATPSAGSPVSVTVVAPTTRPYTLSGLTAGTVYTVTVRAISGAGGGALSPSQVSATTGSAPTTTAPPTTMTTAPPTTTTTTPPTSLRAPVEHAVTAVGAWTVGEDGGVFSYGSAPFLGSTGSIRLNQPVDGVAGTPTGRGYWFVAGDGGIFAFGDARFFGSMGGTPLTKPVVGMASTPSGHGYWLVASDGGIFAFGDARFYGSTGATRLTKPVVGMASTPSGHGYWLVASDGGIFAFGDARFFGSTGGRSLAASVVGMAVSTDGNGYWLGLGNGEVLPFGSASQLGNGAGASAAIAASPGGGYILAGVDGSMRAFGGARSALPDTPALRLNRPIKAVTITLG